MPHHSLSAESPNSTELPMDVQETGEEAGRGMRPLRLVPPATTTNNNIQGNASKREDHNGTKPPPPTTSASAAYPDAIVLDVPSLAPTPRSSNGGNDDRPTVTPTSASTGERRSVWACIFCPLIALFTFFITDSILPQDNFTTRLRKVAVGVLMIGSLFFYGPILDIMAVSTGPRGMSNLYVLILDGIPMIVVPWFTFIYCRVTKTIPDYLFSTLGLVCVFSRIIAATTVHNSDLEPVCFAYLIVLLLTNVPKGVQIAGIIMTSIALIINTLVLPYDLGGIGEYLFFPGTDPSNQVSFLTLGTYRVAFILKTVAILAVISQFNLLVAKAERVVFMCKQLAEKLRKYDTDGARALLLELHHQTGEATIDPELLSIFEGIVENLEKYRPHLPNYLLSDDAEDEEEEQQERGNNDTERGGGDDTTTNHADDRRSNQGGGGGGGNHLLHADETGSHRSYSRSERSAAHGTALQLPSAMHTGRSTVRSADSNVVMTAAAATATMFTVSMKTKVSICFVNIRWIVDFSSPLCNTLVGTINDIAHSTQASLHSFLGDQLVASWNATKRVAKHEARSCFFPLRLRTAIENHTVLKSAVAISSMTAARMAESCFAGDARLRLFALSSPELWRITVAGLDKIRHLNISVADYEVREHAKFDISLKGIAVLPETILLRSKNPIHRCLYQLLNEHEKGGTGGVVSEDQEWMYAIEGQQLKGNDHHVTQAVEAYAAGDAAGAISLLRGIGLVDGPGLGSSAGGTTHGGERQGGGADVEKDRAVSELLDEMELSMVRSGSITSPLLCAASMTSR